MNDRANTSRAGKKTDKKKGNFREYSESLLVALGIALVIRTTTRPEGAPTETPPA